MLRLVRPSPATINRFIERQSSRTLSYSPVGLSASDHAGFRHDRARTRIGAGQPAFERARVALLQWRQFPDWVSVFPRNAPLEVSRTVAAVARHLGFWSLNACRIVEVFNNKAGVFGFAYGTVEDHAESGEERFLVELVPDGSVWYEIRATSRPRVWPARVAFPLARALQARFRRDSLTRMQEAVHG